MGRHSFVQPPQHSHAYRAITQGPLPRLYGIQARWNVPVVEHATDLGEDADFPGVDHYVLTVQTNGVPTRRVDRHGFDATAGQGALSLQEPGSGGSFRSRGRVAYAHLYFRPSLLGEVGHNLGLPRGIAVPDFFAARSRAAEVQAAGYLARAREAEDPPSQIEMDSRAYLVALALIRLVHGPLALTDIDLRRPAPDLRAVIDLVEARLDQPIRLADMAEAVGLSPFYFARLFRARIGQTPAAYVMRRRTERAFELIVGTTLGLAAVAHVTGFSSQSHMTRRIRQLYGTTPRRLRHER